MGYIASGGRSTDERWIGKDLEGSGRVIIEVLACYLHGRTEENRKILSADRESGKASPENMFIMWLVQKFAV
jgi:hypothetical protein